MPTVEETAETQPAEPVSVMLGAVDDTHLQAKTQVNCSTSSETGAAKITVTLTLTVQPVHESAVDVKLPIHVELAGAADTWFGGELSFTLCPAAGSGSTEVSSLFNREASMTEYDVTQPFYVQYTLPGGVHIGADDAGRQCELPERNTVQHGQWRQLFGAV